MGLEDNDFTKITERLVQDFQEQIPLSTLVGVLHACAERMPTEPPDIIEQATRIRLQIRRQGR
jgi:hypothetical protein